MLDRPPHTAIEIRDGFVTGEIFLAIPPDKKQVVGVAFVLIWLGVWTVAIIVTAVHFLNGFNTPEGLPNFLLVGWLAVALAGELAGLYVLKTLLISGFCETLLRVSPSHFHTASRFRSRVFNTKTYVLDEINRFEIGWERPQRPKRGKRSHASRPSQQRLMFHHGNTRVFISTPTQAEAAWLAQELNRLSGKA